MSTDRSDPAGGNESFLLRWSRLKRGEAVPGDAAAPSGTTPRPDTTEAGTEAGTEVGTEAEPLPSLDDITAEGDISAFLRKGVPAALQQLALRKAWSLDPAIRDFIEVAENQYDFNNPGSVPGFGEIDPGTDMSRLLDQAVGRQPAPAELEVAQQPASPAPDVVGSDMAKADMAKADETRADETRAHEPAPAALRRSEASAAAAAGDSETGGNAPAVPPAASGDVPAARQVAPQSPARRRHGGALPPEPA